MAYDYNKVKEQYERMDSQQKQKFADMMKGNANYADFMSRYNAEKTPTVSTTPTTPTKTTTSTTSNQNTGLNAMSSQVAQNNSRNFQVGTGDVAEMPQQPKVQSVQTSSSDRLGKTRGNLTYEQQQERLNRTAGLKDALVQRGITSKTQPTTQTTQPKQTTQQRTSTVPTAKQAQWDYQDNSQARMNQIADNLNNYKQTMPRLFDDASAFYSFFIAGNNRSQEQIDFLWDYFDKAQQFGKYDNLSPDAIGTGIANGTIPEDYLNSLKSTDPQKYQEVISYKKDTEDRIMNESYLNDIAAMAGMEGWESEPSSIQYGKRNGIWLDENEDWIDDRRYHAPTEEELQLSQEDSEYEAEKLRLKNAYKDLQSDLTEQYPDADLSTIMILTSDRGTKIQKALDTISVAQTKTQGRLSYIQNERATMDKAGADSIAQLQKNLGMYYQYSPEGIAELAQAQYGATNITLDQADYGTDTQKQMALQRVLDDYYAKYGDIIQRSEAQVINDVMALAEQKGISLSQALEENFLKYLRQKPGFEELSTIETKNPEIVKVGDNAYAYWDDNGNLVSIGGTLGANGVYQFSDAELRTVGSDGKFTDTVGNDINSIGHILNSEDGLRIGTYTNPKGYTYNVYATREDGIQATENLLKRAYYGMTLGDAAQKWIGQGKDISDAKKVIQSKGLGLNDKLSDANVRKFIEAIGTREGTLKGKSLDEWAKGGKTLGTPKGTEGGQKRNSELETFLDKWKDAEGDRLKEKDFWATYGKELEAKGVSKESFLKQFKEYYSYQSRDAYLEILANLDHLIELTGGEFDLGERASALSGLGDAGKVFKYIKNNLTVNGLQEARDRGLKLGVLSDSDVKMIAEAASVLDWDVSQGTWNRALQDFRQSLLNNNPYLKEQYKYQSAYSPNKGFKYNDNDRSFTFGTRRDESGTQGTTQGTTTQAKSIKNLGK